MELVYFDPEFQRWQLFQEGTAATGGHRGHIESLLASLRATFAQVPRGVPFELTPDSAGKPISLSLNKKHLSWLTEGDASSRAWTIFIEDLIKNAGRDSILNAPADDGSGAHRTIGQLLETLKAWNATSSKRRLSITRPCARNLISLLPILRHWDLYGAISHAWAPGPKQPPHTLWQQLGRAREPFYCNHFVYYQTPTGRYPTSRTVLKYEISAEAVFTDLATGNHDPVWITPRDYFDYAYKPDEEDLSYYRIYSFFMDRLQLALSSPTEESSQDLYYIAYPVFSGLSRRHFLHIYVRPSVPDAPLRELWQAWREWHPFLNWDDLRRLLIDELEQVDLARFQTRVIERIEKHCKTKRVLDKHEEPQGAGLCRSLVADQLHLLFPVRCACADGRIGLYEPAINLDTIPGTVPWDNLAPPERLDKSALETIACRGQIGTSPSCERIQSGRGPGGDLLWDEQVLGPHSAVQAEIARGRRERLLAQQIEFASMIWRSHKGTRMQTLADKEEAWKNCQAVLLICKTDLLAEISKLVGSFKERFNSDSVKRLLKTRDPRIFFEPYFYLHSLDPEDERAWEAVLCEIAQGSLHRLVSEYIETGVVRWLTHTPRRDPSLHYQEPEALSANCLKREHEIRWRALNMVLDSQAAFAEASRKLKDLSSAVQEFLEIHDEIKAGDEVIGDKLKPLRDVLRPKIGLKTRTKQVAASDFLTLSTTETVHTEIVGVDLPHPCFGIPEQTWSAAVESFRASKRDKLNLLAGFVKGNETRIAVPSVCHPGNYQNIPFFPVYVLIGNEIEDAEPSERLPERFKKLQDILLGLGEVFWLMRLDDVWSMRRLPDLCKRDVPECLTTRVGGWTKTGVNVEFIVGVLERFEIP